MGKVLGGFYRDWHNKTNTWRAHFVWVKKKPILIMGERSEKNGWTGLSWTKVDSNNHVPDGHLSGLKNLVSIYRCKSEPDHRCFIVFRGSVANKQIDMLEKQVTGLTTCVLSKFALPQGFWFVNLQVKCQIHLRIFISQLIGTKWIM